MTRVLALLWGGQSWPQPPIRRPYGRLKAGCGQDCPPSLVDGRGDNQAETQGERADQNRQGHVVLVNDLRPEMIGSQLVQNEKGGYEDQNADKGKHQRVDN